MMGWYGFGWGGMLLMMLSMVFWALVVGLLVWALIRWLVVRSPSGGAPWGPPSGPSAMEILRQRYARGEIDAATFDQMRERLEASGTGSAARASDPLASR